jgi:hypothetical protein
MSESKGKHTKGKWKIKKSFHGCEVYSEINNVIAFIGDVTPLNARLIAAAPDLLAACKIGLMRAKYIRNLPMEKLAKELLEKHIKMIESAIRQAEGEGEMDDK